ncbi:MAG TPA: ABC transporter substrate-binding protein [Solirubrobacteraceae bacterium]|nr:ABC transporter substrate-binding protein [Solirubrobacteraceae bacterium]
MNIRHGAGVLLAAAALLVAACGDDSDSTATAGSGSGASAKAPEKLVIGYQAIPNGDLIVKHEGWLEQALPDTKIEWKQFDSGGSVNEAIAADSLDIGLAGSSPVSRGLSQPLEYQVPWIHDVIGKAEALTARKGITSIAQLKGKKIATPLASTSHYSLLAALQEAGLEQKDVKIVDAEPPDIAAAWERGDIDAAYVWNPVLAQLVKDGATILADSEQLAEKGKTTYDLAVVANDFAEQYPDAVKTWVAQQDRAVKLIRSQPDKAAEDVAAELNLEPAEAKAQMEDLIFLDASQQAAADALGDGLGKALFATATFNQELGQIPKTQDEASYADAVKPEFAQQVAQG